MSNNVKIIIVPAGFTGCVSVISRAMYTQRATVKLFDVDGDLMGSTVFMGSGENVVLTEKSDPSSTGYSFGPWNDDARIEITIENKPNGTTNFRPSHTLNPINSPRLQVVKSATKKTPIHYRGSTILSEDTNDNDYDDCIVSVFAFKQEGGGC
ncbi:hypothetical protein H0H92_001109 [Tricholoma furcatifolium]|nr:hypothetical protein H0H92_001109 [Tricholoma furcatifolium]